ncbi:Solute carrier family 2, facilitated glucose transporter member 8 [Oopsacas minuta]|uniref:Solute carrier family 2, facilitated glucose transporter member 8 n=1 Tax=Oopsacas minuta TaxID=111878 RepID=A0AAV7K6J1_9METZ|nr:Solute carrier family 2, facilitated glucose transporter member 8 [Oopsacas minuta]
MLQEYSPLLHSNSSSFRRNHASSNPLSDITGASFSQTISIPEENKSKRFCIGISSTLVLSLGGLIVGYGLGYSSPASADLSKSPLNAIIFPLFSSLYNLGGAIGSLLTLATLNRLGRKFSLYLSLILFQIGWLLIAIVPKNPYSLIAGRVVSGLGMGICTTVTPTYLAEISPPKYRGFYCSFFQFFIALGILVVYSLGACLGTLTHHGIIKDTRYLSADNYVYLALFIVLVITIQSILLFYLYPSPYWLLFKSLHAKAYKVFSYYWGYSNEASIEISQVVGRVRYIGPNQIRTLLLPEVFAPCLVGCGIMFFQQFTGINALVFYESSILQTSLLKYELSGNVASIPPALVQVIFTIIASLCVDKIGRKKLLILASIGMGFSMAILTVYEVFVTYPNLYLDCTLSGNALVDSIQCQLLGWTAIASICIFNAAFALGWGPVPWIVVAEITNVRWKNLTMGVIVFVSWFSAFIVTLIFPYYKDLVYSFGVFSTFFIFNILSIIFVVILLPETRKKNLIEIENFFGSKAFPFFRF